MINVMIPFQIIFVKQILFASKEDIHIVSLEKFTTSLSAMASRIITQ
jgi:hypothetical protein